MAEAVKIVAKNSKAYHDYFIEEKYETGIELAVMGCAVNGPGEAADADVGIAGGKGEGLLFRKGRILRKVPQDQLVNALMEEIHKLP